MAPLSKTALRRNKLKDLTAGPATPASGHAVIKVEFLDFDGSTKTGYFKPLDESYPELLAKISVATSVIMRLSLGERAAEDRLVYDDNDNIVGTVSIALEEFKPFNYGSELVPENPQEKEKVIPSYQTLMQYNVMELLFFSWFLGNDDLHPKNIGLKGIIDWDMFFYAVTEIIKAPRFLGSSPKGEIKLSSTDFGNFPILSPATKPTHWPSLQLPGNLFYPKRYANYEQFAELSKNPALGDESIPGGKITAQEQLFTAVLKALLSYQPEALKRRLKDAIGKEPLNFSHLDSMKKAELEKKFPRLFNPESDKQPFIDFMTELYQLYYDELYRTAVFFIGCENSSGTQVPGFSRFLYRHPHAFKNIHQWLMTENSSRKEQGEKSFRFANEEEYSELRKKTACATSLRKAAKINNAKGQLQEDELKRRYHQIWRDSHTVWIKDILNKARELSASLQHTLSLAGTASSLGIEISERKPEDSSINNAWQLLPVLPEKSTVQLDCDINSDMRSGLLELIELNRQLFEKTNHYWQIQREKLTPLDNMQFIDELQKIYKLYLFNVVPKLGEHTTFGKTCKEIATELHNFSNMANFLIHCNASTDSVSLTLVSAKESWPKHTDSKVVDNCLNALFNWVKELDAQVLSDKINKIIDEDYVGGILSHRTRETPVKTYLLNSREEAGDDRLAFILSSGNSADNGALNTLLVDKLIREMLAATQKDVKVYLPSVRAAIEEDSFAKDFYTRKAIEYAKSNPRFQHIYSAQALEAINHAIYQWIDSIDSKKFFDITKSAIHQYEKCIWSIWTTSRRTEVERYFSSKMSNPCILAQIFSKGGFETTSLNTILFNTIISAMAKTINSDSNKLQQKNNKLILSLALAPEYQAHFLPHLRSFAEKYEEYQQKKPTLAKLAV